MGKSIIKAILDKDWATCQEVSDKMVTDSILRRIESKKQEILKKINEGVVVEAKEDPKAEVRNRPECIFDNTNPKVKDNKDHFPIDTEKRARNALAQANKFTEVPDWYSGSLTELVKTVAKAIKKKYPDIDVTEKSEKPGKN